MTEGPPHNATEEPTPPAEEQKRPNFWRRRSLVGKTLIILGSLFVLLLIAGAFIEEEEEDTPAAEATDVPATPEEEQEAIEEEAEETPIEEEREEEPAPPPPQAPPPTVLEGQGSRVESISVAQDSPLVLVAQHQGSRNFIVELVDPGGGSELFVNEIGSYSGEVAWGRAESGDYRVQVEADGAWRLSFRQPIPLPGATEVPATLSGTGSGVTQIRTSRALQPIVAAQHRGERNFIVELIGLGDFSGVELLFNEIGNHSGETLVRSMPEGNYLVAVQADGNWQLEFSE